MLLERLRMHDKQVEEVLSRTMMWVIPSLNPDTYDSNVHLYRQKGRYGMHRKNNHNVCTVKTYYFLLFSSRWHSEDGIDLNRNFPVCFDVDNQGSDSNPCSEIFRVFLIILFLFRGFLHFPSQKQSRSPLFFAIFQHRPI